MEQGQDHRPEAPSQAEDIWAIRIHTQNAHAVRDKLRVAISSVRCCCVGARGAKCSPAKRWMHFRSRKIVVALSPARLSERWAYAVRMRWTKRNLVQDGDRGRGEQGIATDEPRGRETLSPGGRRGGEDVRAACFEMGVRAKDRAEEPRAKGDADLRYPA